MSVTQQTNSITVYLDGSGIQVEVEADYTLRDALELTGIQVNTECNGLGICGQCRVHYISGAPAPNLEESYLLSEQDLANGWRLACQSLPQQNCQILLRKENNSEKMRVLTNVTAQETLMSDDGDRRFEKGFGVAVDVGTTTIACYLVDLAEGREIDLASFANPQRRFGADVISRIQYSHQSADALGALQRVLIEQIEQHLLDLCAHHQIPIEQVEHMVAVGNSTMMHLLWGVDPWALGVAPYQPAFTKTPPRYAKDIGFKYLDNLSVELLPGVAGHLGADTVAGLVSLDFDKMRGACLFLDLGTNGEIVLIHNGMALGCTCAAGPAFEGVHISSGTPALKGAVDRVMIEGGALNYSTIGDASPVGLCGSGLLDTVSLLLKMGIIESSGRFRRPEQFTKQDKFGLLHCIQNNNNSRRFVICHNDDGEPIALTQADIRQVQLAKSAFRTGVDFLLNEMGIEAEDVSHIYLGGGFGSHLRMEALIALGVLPGCMEGKIQSVGNVAGYGAKLSLINPGIHGKAQQIADWVRNIVLESQAGFTQRFTENLAFPGVEE